MTTNTLLLVAALAAALPAAASPSTPLRAGITAAVPAAPVFPRPAGLVEAADPLCKEAEAHVVAGRALEEEYWTAVTCVAGRLPDDRARKDFFAAVERHRLEATAWFGNVSASTLPADLKARVEGSSGLAYLYMDPAKASDLPDLKRPEPHLAFGTWRGICLPWQSDGGHSGVTKNALTALGPGYFSAKASSIVIDASQDVDLFEWSVMEAHAQTAAAANGMPEGDPAVAQAKLTGWLTAHADKVKSLCAAGDPASIRQALYWTGYLLHAVEDLGSHRGRTNEEHAFNAATEKNPDADEASVALATDLTVRVLRKAFGGKLKGCRAKFNTYSGAGVYYDEKVDAAGPFKRKFEMTPAEVAKYKSSAKIFAPVKDRPGARVRWFGPQGSTEKSCDKVAGCLEFLPKIQGTVQ